MRKLKIALACCALTSAVFFSGIALAQDSYVNQKNNAEQQITDIEKESNAKQQIIGFGTGTGLGSGGGFGSSAGPNSVGGSMSSMNAGHGFGAGFDSGTGSGPMSSGDAWSTGNTAASDGGWSMDSIQK